MSAAIAGSEVAITVESMFSMNKATATISGTILLESMGGTSVGGREVRPYQNSLPCWQPGIARALIVPKCADANPPSSCQDEAEKGRRGIPVIYILAIFIPPLAD